ncbi:DUF6265 family protein [Povalibacter sp.]|uniref:DUF6265 family protein n=1 Tax=Povalibacter sp. TaxID=1962978 RepID=UPI002F40446D
MRSSFFAAVIASTLFAPVVWSADHCRSLAVADWLLGTWVAIAGDKTVTETWSRLSDATFEGKGVTTKGASRAIVDDEALRLLQMANGVFYVSKVAHNRLPVAFELADCSPSQLVFENPQHDFPRRLEYVANSAGQMTVRVSDGKDKGFTLTFKRQPEKTS